MERVDVVVPCYRYGRFLSESVGSVLGQEGVDVRVLIVDDASDDNTAEVAAELAALNPRVEVATHRVNRGHLVRHNEGLAWATAEYAVILSADDALTRGALARATRVMNDHPNVGFVYGPAIRTANPTAHPYAPPRRVRYRVVPSRRWIRDFCQRWVNPVTHPTAVVRTRVCRQVGGYRADLKHAGDMEFWFGCGMHGDVGVLAARQAYYRVHGANMHCTFDGLAAIGQKKAALDAAFERYGRELPDAARMQKRASRQIAVGALRHARRALGRGDAEACRALLTYVAELDATLPRARWMQWRHVQWRLARAGRSAAAGA
jgi:hypothetical protein